MIPTPAQQFLANRVLLHIHVHVGIQNNVRNLNLKTAFTRSLLLTHPQELSSEVTTLRTSFEDLLKSCDLFDTPFDTTKVEADVSSLKDKMYHCDKVRSTYTYAHTNHFCV